MKTTIKRKVDELLSKMTADEKIGQMTQPDRKFLKTENDIKKLFLGSLLSGGGSTPEVNRPPAWAAMCDRYQKIALQTRLKIPLLYGIDAVHGHNNVVGSVIFPHNIGLGCANDAALAERCAAVTAAEVRATGIRWTFSPCLAVARNEKWGRTFESFGEDARLSAKLGAAEILGYQGKDPSGKGRVLACAKHFLGDGGTTGGVDQGDTRLDEAAMRSAHLLPYISAVKAGVKTVMASYNSHNGNKMHGHKRWITDVLKKELGFEGMVVSDWMGVDQLADDYAGNIARSINAGVDMVMVPDRYEECLSALKQHLANGTIPLSRVDDAVRRILGVKFEAGLFDAPFSDKSLLSKVGCAAHREVAREAVRKSLVVLKNRHNALPLSRKMKKIAVVGKHGHDVGLQCGGWTISWFGGSGPSTKGTTIYEGLKKAAGKKTEVVFSEDGSGIDGAEAVVAVFGEYPYAEYTGDTNDLSLSPESVALVNKVRKLNVPTIAVLISGRPLIIDSVLAKCDAFVAAWLPGTEGQGVADVLFGDYAPTGKLCHSWPRNMAQIPVNFDDRDYDPLYEFGHGLTY